MAMSQARLRLAPGYFIGTTAAARLYPLPSGVVTHPPHHPKEMVQFSGQSNAVVVAEDIHSTILAKIAQKRTYLG